MITFDTEIIEERETETKLVRRTAIGHNFTQRTHAQNYAHNI